MRQAFFGLLAIFFAGYSGWMFRVSYEHRHKWVTAEALEGCEDAVHIAAQDSIQNHWMYKGCFNRLQKCLEFNGQSKEEKEE